MSLFERSEIVTERMIIVVKVWVYLAVFTNHVKSEQVFQSEENLLQRSLIEGYNRRARPVKSFASTVNMTFGASLYQLVEFNAKAETMTTLIWQRLQWKDEMLSWNPDDYDGIDVLRYSITDLWVPDILPYNEVGIFDPSKYHKVIPLWVEYDGSVHWTSPLTMTTTCTMDVTNFPFDSQTCMISLGSWQYTADQVDIYCSEDSFDLASYAQHTQWELQKSSCKRQELTSKGNRFSYLTFSANFKRLSDFYIRNLLLPNAGLLALSSLIFLLPAEQGDRIGFGVTLTLSLCVNLMIVTDFIPETSKTIPEICNYFLINIFLSSASIALATVSINLHLWFSKQQGRRKLKASTKFSAEKPSAGRSEDAANNNFTDVENHQTNSSNGNSVLKDVDQLIAQVAEFEGKSRASKLMVKVDVAMGVAYFIGTTTYTTVFFLKIFYH